MTLWDIDGRIQEIVAGLSQSTLEEDRHTWMARFEEAAGELEDKLDQWAAAIAHLEALAKVRSDEAARLEGLARSDQAKATRMREALRGYFATRGLECIDTPRYRLSLVNQGGQPPVHLSGPVEELGPEFRRETTKVSADLEAIRTALFRGEEVRGACLGEKGKTLRIR